MLLTMKAPANRDKGQRIVRCNEAQAEILRKVGWTEVPEDNPLPLSEPSDPPRIYSDMRANWGSVETPSLEPVTEPPKFSEVRDQPTFYAEGSPSNLQIIEPEPVVDPDEVRPKKRTYHRRTVNVEPDGKVNYSIKPPKRRYRRRDLTAEE